MPATVVRALRLALAVSMLGPVAAALPGCRDPHAPPAAEPPQTPPRPEGTAMAFTLTSPAFKQGDRVPKDYTGEGKDLSPPLQWSAPPPGALSFALVCDDPDAPAGTWDHWLIWNIPADRTQLPEGVAKTETPADLGGARQGKNSWPKMGYNGPMPPKGHGTHHYHFALYALDTVLDLKPGAGKNALLAAMEGHVLGQAELVGVYSR